MPPRILYITHRVPHPPDKGDRIPNYNVLRFLAARADVDLVSLSDEAVSPASRSELTRLTRRMELVPAIGLGRWWRAGCSILSGRTISEGLFSSRRVEEILRQWTMEASYSAALLSASSLVPYVPLLKGIPTVVDLVDVDSQKWLDYAKQSSPPRSWLYQTEGLRLRKIERTIPTWSAGVTLVSEAETEIYQSFALPGRVETVKNGVDLEYFAPAPPTEDKEVVFVGALDYKPNVEGITWFVETAWDEIKRAVPDATLSLVGRKPVPQLEKLCRKDGVKLVGGVPDVRPFIRNARVCVVPLRIARGLQNKILEGMAMGRAVVTSRLPLQSLSAHPGRDLLAADEYAEWVTKVTRVLQEPAIAEQIGQSARRYVEEYHCWDQTLRPMARLFGLAEDPAQAMDTQPGRTLDPTNFDGER